MLGIFRGLVDRMKALFISSVALDFEAQFVAGQAERKAELLRRAADYEQEGLQSVALDLRAQAESLSPQRPLASVLPAIGHLQANQEAFLLSHDDPNRSSPTPRSKKKGSRA